MGRIPQDFLDRLLNATDIVALIDNAIPLKKSGTNYQACCPFHEEKTPSFSVSASKQFYHCFGCSAHGNAISFLMEYERLSFLDAIDLLARNAGLELPKDSGGSRKEDDNIHKVYGALRFACDKFFQQLRASPPAIDYLKKRGLSGETAKTFHIGYADDAWDHCMHACMQQGFTETALLQAGLIIRNEEGKCYDRFRGRIIFPIHDHRGRVIGFGGRVLDNSLPKYLNSPETVVFQKGRELYGLYEARMKHRHLSQVIIVEGYMDVIALAEHGIDFAVATLGTATSEYHLQTLFRHTSDIIFCFDGDTAGRKAAWRALEIALPIMQDEKNIRFMFLPQGEDPDSFVKLHGEKTFRTAMQTATPFANFFLETLAAHVDLGTIDGRAHLAKTAMAQLSRLPEGLFKQLMVDALANIVRVDSHELSPKAQTPARTYTKLSPLTKPPSAMRNALALLIQNPRLAACVPSDWPALTLAGGEFFSEVLRILKESPGLQTAALVERFRGHPHAALINEFASQSHAAPQDGIEAEFQDSLNKLIKMQRSTHIENLMARAAVAPGLTPEEKQTLQSLIGAQNFIKSE